MSLRKIKSIVLLYSNVEILDWPKGSFVFFCKMLWKNPNKLFGQPSIKLLCINMDSFYRNKQEASSIHGSQVEKFCSLLILLPEPQLPNGWKVFTESLCYHGVQFSVGFESKNTGEECGQRAGLRLRERHEKQVNQRTGHQDLFSCLDFAIWLPLGYSGIAVHNDCFHLVFSSHSFCSSIPNTVAL